MFVFPGEFILESLSGLLWYGVCTCATANARGLDTNSSLHRGVDFRQKNFEHSEITILFLNSRAGGDNRF